MPRRSSASVRALPAALLAAGLAVLTGCGQATDAEATRQGIAATTAAAPASASLEQLRDSPQARAWQERKRFEQDALDFVREAQTLSTAERDVRARELEAEVRRREAAGELSAGESMLLRAAMIEAQAGTSEEQARRLAELVEHYREDAAQREAAWIARQRRDPRMRQYKSREQAVVAEVMAMDAFPGGMTRDQYLRQRLQEEREATWAD